MSTTIGGINFDSRDPQRLAEFYAAVLDGQIDAFGEYRYVRHTGPLICIQPATGERPERNPIHLDLMTDFGQREAEAARIEALGAIRQWDVLDEVPHVEWSVLIDPEGNYFCVAAPRSPAAASNSAR